jgi:antitoxin (DNA-binding transcriptional repressor) of toxin-antitoxin stability system
METLSIEEAQARFDELLGRVEDGETFVLTRDDVPVVVFGPPSIPDDAPQHLR